MKNFHGSRGSGPFFEGWYLKHQGGGRTIAFIPSFHRDDRGKTFASLQVITGEGSWQKRYPGESFWAHRRAFQVLMGQEFYCSAKGLQANLDLPGLRVEGRLEYGPFTPLESDIMGPFRFVPCLQCNHGVLSLAHTLSGVLTVNGEDWDLEGGTGYLEKDWGNSFPSAYLWTQCGWTHRGLPWSVMISAATIPLGPGGFDGCICALLLGGKQVRIATYLGAKILGWNSRGVLLRQGSLTLEARYLGGGRGGQDLSAPDRGAMSRVIRESASCPVRYRLWQGSRLVMDALRENASFEAGRAGPAAG